MVLEQLEYPQKKKKENDLQPLSHSKYKKFKLCHTGSWLRTGAKEGVQLFN